MSSLDDIESVCSKWRKKFPHFLLRFFVDLYINIVVYKFQNVFKNFNDGKNKISI